jgi:CHAD domain-containing protein
LPNPGGINGLVEQHVDALERYRCDALKGEEGAEEAIHKARVTTRRLQAVADFLRLGPDADRVSGAKRRLRKFRASLSDWRNHDVFLQVVDRAREQAPPSNLPKLEFLKNRLQVRRDKIALKGRRTLKDFDTQGLKDDLQRPDAGETAEAAVETTRQIRQRIARRLSSRLQKFLAVAARLQEDPDTDTLHELRICAKRLRYLLESLASLGYREPKGALRWLRGLQGRIGEWHDLETLEQEIIRIVRKKGFLEGHLSEGSQILEAGWIIVRQKNLKAAKAFPVTPSRFFLASVQRALGDLGQEPAELR